MKVKDCTVLVGKRGKLRHAVPLVGDATTLCGRACNGWTIVTGAMPDCPRCLARLEMS